MLGTDTSKDVKVEMPQMSEDPEILKKDTGVTDEGKKPASKTNPHQKTNRGKTKSEK